MANLRRSLVINFFSNTGSTLLKFIVSVMLARILSPSEIGVFSITVVFVGIAQIFRDFGVSAYLQREKELTPDKIRSAIGVAFASSWLIAAILFACSGAIGDWFGEPAMIPVMRVLSIGFLLIPFGSITGALLAREFAAEKQAWVNAAGTTSYCVSCLVLAYMDFGSMSLAYANLINIIVCGLAYIPFRPAGLPWLPGIAHWRSVINFGFGSIVSNCAVALETAIPDILLGKLGSAHHVGLFSRANSTVTIFTHVAGSTVNYGAISYLSQSYHRGESLTPTLTRATGLLTGVGWTALALTAVLGRDIVLALYGENWLESVPAIAPLTISAAIVMLFHYNSPALTAIGKPYLSAVPVLVNVLARTGFGVMLFTGELTQFAWAVCLATAAAAPFSMYMQARYFGLNPATLLRAVAPSAVVAAVVALAAVALQWALPNSLGSLTKLLVMGPPLAVLWYLALRASGHVLTDEVRLMGSSVMLKLKRT